MNLKIMAYIVFSFFLIGCSSEGTVNIKTYSGMGIYVNNEYIGDAGEGLTKLTLDVGNNTVKVLGYSQDGNWKYEIEKNINVSDKLIQTINMAPYRSPTKQKIEADRVKEERKKRISNENSYPINIDNFKMIYERDTLKKDDYGTVIASIHLVVKKSVYDMIKNNHDIIKNAIHKQKLFFYSADKRNARYYISRHLYKLRTKLSHDYTMDELKSMIEVTRFTTKVVN